MKARIGLPEILSFTKCDGSEDFDKSVMSLKPESRKHLELFNFEQKLSSSRKFLLTFQRFLLSFFIKHNFKAFDENILLHVIESFFKIQHKSAELQSFSQIIKAFFKASKHFKLFEAFLVFLILQFNLKTFEKLLKLTQIQVV